MNLVVMKSLLKSYDENFDEEEVPSFDKVSQNVSINIQHNPEELMLMTLKMLLK